MMMRLSSLNRRQGRRSNPNRQKKWANGVQKVSAALFYSTASNPLHSARSILLESSGLAAALISGKQPEKRRQEGGEHVPHLRDNWALLVMIIIILSEGSGR